MLNQFSRTQLLIGAEGMEKLFSSHVAVFGIGGVGGYVCEALIRSGVGKFDLIDDDKVCLTNLNRQISATRKTVGQYKVDAAEARVKQYINAYAAASEGHPFANYGDDIKLEAYELCPIYRVTLRTQYDKRYVNSGY